ncbi:hypothetical protein ACFL6U_26300 [Planctomycetota bacterium]
MKTKPLSKTMVLLLGAIAIVLPLAVTVLAQTQEPLPQELPALDEGNLRSFIQLVRSDLRMQKAYILAQNMELTDDEAVEFWPLQRDYQTELSKLYDQRLLLTRQFLDAYDTLTEAGANELAEQVLSLEESRIKLKREYFPKFSEVITARKAFRFFQIENQINTAIDLRLAAALPLIK